MSEHKEMSFLGHIGELRAHLVRVLIAIIICSIGIGWNIKWIMDEVFFGPTKIDFISFRAINELSQYFFGIDSFTMPDTFAIQQKKMLEQFNVMMQVSLIGGFILAFPYFVFELWQFIKPALKPSERKNSAFVINFVWILFLIGVLVGYFLILPLAINFGIMFSISDNITQLFDMSDYTSLFLQIVVGMGIVFLFPVIIYFLTQIGLLTPDFLKKYRRHSIILIMVVAAIITPADIFSMFAAALPLLLLFEFSVVLSKRVYRRLQKEEALMGL